MKSSRPSTANTEATVTYPRAMLRPRDAPNRTLSEKCKCACKVVFHHIKVHAGVGLMCSVAYFDP